MQSRRSVLRRPLLLSAFAFTLTVASPGALAFTFITFDVPVTRAGETSAFGINAQGQIVGQYQLPGLGTHGFRRDGTSFTKIDVPRASSTSALGINAQGHIVGGT